MIAKLFNLFRCMGGVYLSNWGFFLLSAGSCGGGARLRGLSLLLLFFPRYSIFEDAIREGGMR